MRRNLLLGVVSITLFFGLLEIGLRLSGSVPTDAIRSPEVETLNAIPGLFEPGQDLVDRIVPQRPYRIQINSLGFRGREFTREKKPGSTRVHCLGDSFTFGHLVGAAEAFPARLEHLLRARGSADDGEVEVKRWRQRIHHSRPAELRAGQGDGAAARRRPRVHPE